MIDEILNIIFPPVCGFCGKINKNYLCSNCEKEIMSKITYGIDNIQDKYFEKHIYLMHYKGIVREKLLSYKFFDKSYMYKTFSKIILKSKKICEILKTYDIIIGVPIHKKRKAERGYDQSALIAKEISKNIENLKYAKAIKKVKNTKKQSLIEKEERLNNVKNAYEIINKEIIYNKKIILFDDIYTTGATANECAKVLKENGAKEVLVLSLAK